MDARAVRRRATRNRRAARTMGNYRRGGEPLAQWRLFSPSAELTPRAHLPVEEPEKEPPDEEPPDTEPPIKEPPVNDPPVNEPPVEDPSALEASNDSWYACSCADTHLLRQAQRRYGATEFMQSVDRSAGGRIRCGSLCQPEGQGTIPDQSCVCVRNVDRSNGSTCIYNAA